MESFTTGTIAGDGAFRCEECGAVGPLARTADVPACPQCGSTNVVRASLFERAPQAEDDKAAERRILLAAGREHARPRATTSRSTTATTSAWPCEGEHTRIGRSLTAEVRFDDPTVSRRHALLVRQDEGFRVVDDRSMNGIFVNGERVEWRILRDGDELLVGRHRLIFIDTTVGSPTPADSNADSTSRV